jgi:hypothetical protein
MAIEVRGPRIQSVQFPGTFEVINSVVHVDGKIAIVCASKLPGPRQLLLASFDPQQGLFTLSSYQRQTVLSFGNETLVVEPDYSVLSAYMRSHEVPDGECFYEGAGIYVRVHEENTPTSPGRWPVLNLINGEVFDYPPSQRVHVFKRWRLGVRHGERVTWLLAVGGSLENWASSGMPK